MTKNTDTTSVVANAAANASAAANSAAQAAAKAADNAAIAAKAASDSATAIAVVATDTSWMKKSLGGIENTLEEMRNAYITLSQHQEVLNVQTDHEKRIRTLETRTLMWMGAISIVTAFLTMGIGIALKFIR